MDLAWPTYDLDRDARAIFHAASAIASRRGWGTMTPEVLLYAALHDEAVRTFWGPGADALVTRLRASIERGQAAGSDLRNGADGWSPSARGVAFNALLRASRRGRKRPPTASAPAAAPKHWAVRALMKAATAVGGTVIGEGTWIARGDLIHALGVSPCPTSEHLIGLPRLFGALDEEDPPVPPGDASGQPPPAGVGRASVVLDDDSVTSMVAVRSLITDALGLAPDRAEVAMHRVHFRGADRVVTCSWETAQESLLRVRKLAADSAPSLVVRLVAD